MTSRISPSKLSQFLASERAILEIDNDVAYHVATNAIRLRRLRGTSQAAVAQLMGTSQSRVARIESGDDNITLATLRRVATALRGRVRLSIEPVETNVPQLPPWWDFVENGVSSGQRWELRQVMAVESTDAYPSTKYIGAAWTASGAATVENAYSLFDDGES